MTPDYPLRTSVWRRRPRLRVPVRATTFAILALALAALAGGCQGVLGSDATPAAGRTARATSVAPAATATAEPSASAEPSAAAAATSTSVPALPANPQALQRWRDFPIAYCTSRQGTGYMNDDALAGAAARAFAAWGVPVTYAGACGAPIDDNDVNEIGWGALNDAAPPDETSYEAGVTNTRYKLCTANCSTDDTVHIIEADIRIDSAPPPDFRTPACLYATMLHETGHFLGIEHLPPPAVMAAETQDCLQALTLADIAALRARYGAVAAPAAVAE